MFVDDHIQKIDQPVEQHHEGHDDQRNQEWLEILFEDVSF